MAHDLIYVTTIHHTLRKPTLHSLRHFQLLRINRRIDAINGRLEREAKCKQLQQRAAPFTAKALNGVATTMSDEDRAAMADRYVAWQDSIVADADATITFLLQAFLGSVPMALAQLVLLLRDAAGGLSRQQGLHFDSSTCQIPFVSVFVCERRQRPDCAN